MRAQGGGERREGRGKWAAGGVGSEEGVGRRKRTGPSEWLGQGGLKKEEGLGKGFGFFKNTFSFNTFSKLQILHTFFPNSFQNFQTNFKTFKTSHKHT
jgi:hypothetical protein